MSKEDEKKNSRISLSLKQLFLNASFGLFFGIIGAYGYTTFQPKNFPSFVTISVAKIIEYEAKKIDGEMIRNNSIFTDNQLQEKIEKYTQKITDSLANYSKANKVIVLEKGAIVSDGFGIQDITDDFIKAVNE